MKNLIFLLCIEVFFCNLAFAKDNTPTHKVQADYGVGCRISVALPISQDGGLGADAATGLGGMAVNPLPKAWASKLDALGFGISCNPAEELDRPQTWGILDAKSQRWIENPESMRKELKASTNAYERNLADRIIATTNIYDIRAVNSHGWVETFEDLTGDERFRKRSLVFCLFESSKVLCGRGDVAYLNDGKRGDLTPIALKIIQSIEFLPDVKPSKRDAK